MTTRRNFLKGCSAAVAAMSGARISGLTFGSPSDINQETLICVYLRGGLDALNLAVPLGSDGNSSYDDRALYESARPQIKVQLHEAQGQSLGSLNGTEFGLNPKANPLFDLFQDNKMAVVMNAGSVSNSRSHFDMMHWMELGTADMVEKKPTNGWLARHLGGAPDLDGDILIPSIAVGNGIPESLAGSNDTLTLGDSSLNLDTEDHIWAPQQRIAMRSMFGLQDDVVHRSGYNALDATEILDGMSAYGTYEPSLGVSYPVSLFGVRLQTVAELVKMQLGLRTVTIDFGGWDTHDGQGQGTQGYYADLLSELSTGLKALWDDLDLAGSASDLTIMLMTEFGRRVEENSGLGTDHGHGGATVVIGNNVVPGLHGQWDGLHGDNLYENIDLPVNTDFRDICMEYLMLRQKNPKVGVVFPEHNPYTPVGVFSGTALEPDYTNTGVEPTVTVTPVVGSGKLGDVNCDGNVSLIDANMVKQYNTTSIGDTDSCEEASSNQSVYLAGCDINDDGQCGLIDAAITLQCNAFIDNPFCSTIQ